MAKSLGSNNPANVVKATILGLSKLRSPEEALGSSAECLTGGRPLAGKLRITWRKSDIGYAGDQKAHDPRLWGLRRLGHTVEHDDIRSIRGMVTKVRHLVEVVEVPQT